MKKVIENDLYRFSGKRNFKAFKTFFKYDMGFRFMYFWRNAKESKGIKRYIYNKCLNRIKKYTRY